MANYAVTDWVSVAGDLPTVLAAIETYLETVTSTFTIHLLEVHHLGSGLFQAVCIHNAA